MDNPLPAQFRVNNFEWLTFPHQLDVIRTQASLLFVNSEVGITPTPEFPSAVLPFTFVIGFLGVVLVLRRGREY